MVRFACQIASLGDTRNARIIWILEPQEQILLWSRAVEMHVCGCELVTCGWRWGRAASIFELGDEPYKFVHRRREYCDWLKDIGQSKLFQALSLIPDKRLLASHVRQSVRMYRRGSHWTDVREIFGIGRLLWKSVEKIEIWFRSDKNIL